MALYRSIIGIILTTMFSFSAISQHIEPKPIMGQKVFKQFIKTHIDYPEKDYQLKIQGTVVIEFTVDPLGNVTNYSISQHVSDAIDSVAIVIFKLVLWKPATSYGKQVKGTAEFEIKYNVKSYNKIVKRRGYNHITPPNYTIDNTGKMYSLKQLDTIPHAILPSGTKSVSSYIYKNLTYPDAAAKLALSGKVELSFIIETNGLPSNIIVTKHLGGGCTEEAIRIIETIKWQPGVLNNQAVRTQYAIPINFKKGDGRDGHIPNQQGSGI
ncbi:MAG: energy transducer TonB [Bacteroidota bacterium]